MMAFIKGLTPVAKQEVFRHFQPLDGVRALNQDAISMNYDILIEADEIYCLIGSQITCIGSSEEDYVRISNKDYETISFS